MNKNPVNKTIIIVVTIFSALTISSPSFSIGRTDAADETYLKEHGHSPELIRMVNLQRQRTEENPSVQVKKHNIIVKFFKNLWFEQDFTMSIDDFGYSCIKSPETGKELIRKDITDAAKKLPEIKERLLNSGDKNNCPIEKTNSLQAPPCESSYEDTVKTRETGSEEDYELY